MPQQHYPFYYRIMITVLLVSICPLGVMMYRYATLVYLVYLISFGEVGWQLG